MDGVLFKVVAKGEVAQHLKKSVMAWAGADIFQIVVFAADAHRLLGGDGAFIVPFFQPQKEIFKLDHAGVGQEQRRVVNRHQAAAVDHGVIIFGKEVKPKLTDFVRRESFHHRPARLMGCMIRAA